MTDIVAADIALLDAAARAAASARAPISRFAVGAAARGASGQVHLGANLEFTGLPLSFSVHAEQAAIVAAMSAGETAIVELALTAPPCGYCRQFLMELERAEGVRVLVAGAPPALLGALLPAAFGPADLGVTERLLRPSGLRLRLGDASPPAVAVAALTAASASYAPYGRVPAGLALALDDGSLRTGMLIETAAYNPGLSPLQSALSGLAMAGLPYTAIRGAALVELAGPVNQRPAVEALLAAVAPAVGLGCHRAVAG